MKKMRTLRQPVVAPLPGLDDLDGALLKIRLRSMAQAAQGKVSTTRVLNLGNVMLLKRGSVVSARVDGEPMPLATLKAKAFGSSAKVSKSAGKRR